MAMVQTPYKWILDDDPKGLVETVEEMMEEGKVMLSIVPLAYADMNGIHEIFEALIITY
jgi:hypothetical protein